VNLSIQKGEFVFVVGSSGAGKSTLIKLLMREEVATGGVVRVGDQNLGKMKRSQIPYLPPLARRVFQDFAYPNHERL
jgi:cell division transport system ATP-binding protein